MIHQLFELSQEQVAPIRPCFGQERGVKRVDARKYGPGSIDGTRSSLLWGG